MGLPGPGWLEAGSKVAVPCTEAWWASLWGRAATQSALHAPRSRLPLWVLEICSPAHWSCLQPGAGGGEGGAAIHTPHHAPTLPVALLTGLLAFGSAQGVCGQGGSTWGCPSVHRLKHSERFCSGVSVLIPAGAGSPTMLSHGCSYCCWGKPSCHACATCSASALNSLAAAPGAISKLEGIVSGRTCPLPARHMDVLLECWWWCQPGGMSRCAMRSASLCRRDLFLVLQCDLSLCLAR